MIHITSLHIYGGPGRVLPQDPSLFSYPTRTFEAKLAIEINEPALLANEVNVRGKVSVELDFQGGL